MYTNLEIVKFNYKNCCYCQAEVSCLRVGNIDSYFCSHCRRISIKVKNKDVIHLVLRHDKDYEIRAHQGSIIFRGTDKCPIKDLVHQNIKAYDCNQDIFSDQWLTEANNYVQQVNKKINMLTTYR